MVTVTHKPVTHEIAKGGKVCPECGVSLAGLDRTAHARHHWPKQNPLRPTLKGDALQRFLAIIGEQHKGE